jgi:esterase/lipase superfamily enzyme
MPARRTVAAEDVTVLFATNREPLGDPRQPSGFGTRPNNDGAELRFGACIFAGAMRVRREVKPPSNPSLTPFPEDRARNVLGSAALFERVRAMGFDDQHRATHDLLVYVHGFETTFDEALAVTAQTVINMASVRLGLPADQRPRPLIPVVFTWPSDGERSVRAYWDDVDDAERSGPALRRAMQFLAGFLAAPFGTPPVASGPPMRLVLMVQSMGHLVLSSAIRDDRFPAVIDLAVSTGGDIEADAFERADRYARLPDLVGRSVIYHSEKDGPLQISQKLRAARLGFGHAGPRLGQTGPVRALPHATVETVDVSEVLAGANDDLYHFYGRLNPNVQADILRVLAGIPAHAVPHRRSLGDRRYALRFAA